MPEVEACVLIDRPIEDVGAFVGNPENVHVLQQRTEEGAYMTQRPVGVGTGERPPPVDAERSTPLLRDVLTANLHGGVRTAKLPIAGPSAAGSRARRLEGVTP